MTTTHSRPLFGSLLAICTLLAACTGDAGPTGPQGPQGDSGPQGPIGPQGPTGNANIVSGQATLGEADWSATTVQIVLPVELGAVGGKPARFLDIPVPEITADVYSKGVVFVWMEVSQTAAGGAWFAPLPWSFIFLSATVEYHYQVAITEGNIRVLFIVQNLNDPTDSGNPLAPGQGTTTYRWVIIPPAAASALEAGSSLDGLPVVEGANATIDALERLGFRVDSAVR